MYYVFKRCGLSDKEFSKLDTVKGQSILSLYIYDEMKTRALFYTSQGKDPRKHDSIYAEYDRNLERNQRQWLQPKK